jgi:hypothetical protein
MLTTEPPPIPNGHGRLPLPSYVTLRPHRPPLSLEGPTTLDSFGDAPVPHVRSRPSSLPRATRHTGLITFFTRRNLVQHVKEQAAKWPPLPRRPRPGKYHRSRTGCKAPHLPLHAGGAYLVRAEKHSESCHRAVPLRPRATGLPPTGQRLVQGGDPAAPSGTATLLRLSPSH